MIIENSKLRLTNFGPIRNFRISVFLWFMKNFCLILPAGMLLPSMVISISFGFQLFSLLLLFFFVFFLIFVKITYLPKTAMLYYWTLEVTFEVTIRNFITSVFSRIMKNFYIILSAGMHLRIMCKSIFLGFQIFSLECFIA